VTTSPGFTIWLTGLSGAGKSTLARALEQALRDRQRHVEVLDGDEVRENLSKGLGFSKEDRDTNIRRIAYVAKLVSRSGGVAITAAISPYRAIRDEARAQIGPFVEVPAAVHSIWQRFGWVPRPGTRLSRKVRRQSEVSSVQSGLHATVPPRTN